MARERGVYTPYSPYCHRPNGEWVLTESLTSLRMTQTGQSVITERRRASRGPKVGSTSPSAIPFWNIPGRKEEGVIRSIESIHGGP